MVCFGLGIVLCYYVCVVCGGVGECFVEFFVCVEVGLGV